MRWQHEDVRCRAHHESGHALAAVVLGISIESVSIAEDPSVIRYGPRPGLEDALFTLPTTLDDARRTEWSPTARARARREIVTFAAGPVSQMIYQEGPEVPIDSEGIHLYGGWADIEAIEGFALRLAADAKLSDEQLLAKRDCLVRDLVADATRLVRRHWPALQSLASELAEAEGLAGHEVERILEEAGVKLPAG